MTENGKEIVQQVERVVKSKQPRFDKRSAEEFVRQIIYMVQRADYELPFYSSDTRKRDKELLRFVRSESLLSGVVSSAVSRDKNRGWTLTGAARQVSAFGKKLHSVHDGEGWRQFISLNANCWYCTDFGYASEIGFSKRGVAETMWHLDPTHCRITGINNPPMYYYPDVGKVPLKRYEYIHGNSMPSPEENMNRAGFCSVERALEFSRLMVGINKHQLEKLGVSPAKGIILSKGIKREEFSQAVAQANEDAENAGAFYYRGVLALFTNNTEADIELIGLSELPENFELTEFIDVIMQGYALSFGYPVGEFWAIHSGSFGRTGEMKEQQQQATAKGELDFALSLQEQLQTYFLPPTIDFQFDQRNDRGELVRAETVTKAWQIIKEAYETGLQYGQPIISKEQAKELMADLGIIPQEWTEITDDVTASDLKEIRERALSKPEIIDAIYRMPDEPIVSYTYSPRQEIVDFTRKRTKVDQNAADILKGLKFPPGEVKVLWNSGSDAIKNRYFGV